MSDLQHQMRLEDQPISYQLKYRDAYWPCHCGRPCDEAELGVACVGEVIVVGNGKKFEHLCKKHRDLRASQDT